MRKWYLQQIGEQRRLRPACAVSPEPLLFAHESGGLLEEASDKEPYLWLYLVAAKNHKAHEPKVSSLIRWLIFSVRLRRDVQYQGLPREEDGSIWYW